jgi:hypothetical protein
MLHQQEVPHSQSHGRQAAHAGLKYRGSETEVSISKAGFKLKGKMLEILKCSLLSFELTIH